MSRGESWVTIISVIIATNIDLLFYVRHLLSDFTCIMSFKSTQQTYDIGTMVSPILQIRKLKPREVGISIGSFAQTNDLGGKRHLELH